MIAKSRAGAVSFADVGKVEKCSRSFLEGKLSLLVVVCSVVAVETGWLYPFRPCSF